MFAADSSEVRPGSSLVTTRAPHVAQILREAQKDSPRGGIVKVLYPHEIARNL